MLIELRQSVGKRDCWGEKEMLGWIRNGKRDSAKVKVDHPCVINFE